MIWSKLSKSLVVRLCHRCSRSRQSVCVVCGVMRSRQRLKQCSEQRLHLHMLKHWRRNLVVRSIKYARRWHTGRISSSTTCSQGAPAWTFTKQLLRHKRTSMTSNCSLMGSGQCWWSRMPDSSKQRMHKAAGSLSLPLKACTRGCTIASAHGMCSWSLLALSAFTPAQFPVMPMRCKDSGQMP